MTADIPPIARLTLERLARPVPDWTDDARCLKEGVDMMTATKTEMDAICGRCIVREQCEEGANDGTPVRVGVRGGHWRSRRTAQQP